MVEITKDEIELVSGAGILSKAEKLVILVELADEVWQGIKDGWAAASK